jgi:Na+-driven multidrug efflux pump
LLVGTNQSRFLIYGTLAEALTNIVLDYGLIFGHFGLPRLGFNGAALASIIAEAAGMVVVFAVIRAVGIGKQLFLTRMTGFDRVNASLILVQSSPLMFQYAISIISWEYFYILIEHHGERDLAISNAMRNIFGLFGIFTWAFASATNAMVSNVIGQGKKDQVMMLIGKILKLSVSFSVTIAVLLNFFPQVFLSLYGQDQAFMEAAIPIVRVVSTALVMMSFAMVWLNAVTGTGNTRINLAIEIITILFYCIYVWLVLAYWNLSIIYGWMSEWLYWSITFSLSYMYIRSGRWQHKTI